MIRVIAWERERGERREERGERGREMGMGGKEKEGKGGEGERRRSISQSYFVNRFYCFGKGD